MATKKLKSTRSAEQKKVDLAVKYSEQGKATGGGRLSPKKVRRAMEARRGPLFQSVPEKPARTKKPKKPMPTR